MSIIEQAKSELALNGAGDEYISLVVSTLEQYFERYDSGGAVAATASMFTGHLQRLIAGKPLSPLTGADDEWRELGAKPADEVRVFQNRRCSTVYKNVSPDGEIAYDIDNATPSGRPITFPYNAVASGEDAMTDAPSKLRNDSFFTGDWPLLRHFADALQLWSVMRSTNGSRPTVADAMRDFNATQAVVEAAVDQGYWLYSIGSGLAAKICVDGE